MIKNIVLLFVLLVSSVLKGQLLIDFELDTTNYPIVGEQVSIVDNPDQEGNPSSKCAYYRKTEGNWHPFIIVFPDTLNTENNDRLSFKVRTSTSGRIYIKFWNGEEIPKESWVREYNYRPMPDEWTELTYDISDIQNQDLTMIEITASVDNIGPADVYYDDIKIYDSISSKEDGLFTKFHLSEKRILLGDSLRLDATSSADLNDDNTIYQWDLGDGNTVTNQLQFTHTYELPGIYEVSLIAIDSLGFSANTIQKVWVYDTGVVISPFFENTEAYLTHEKVELSFWTVEEAENPYNPDEIEINAWITLPDERTIKVPCFYYVDSYYEDQNWMIDESENRWMLRFSSSMPGTCSITIEQKIEGSTKNSASRTIFIIPGNEKGIIRRDTKDIQYYRHSTGEPYYPLGINAAWDDIENYRLITENLGIGQANFIRYWHAAFTNQALEWNRYGLGQYNPIAAAKQDSLLELCRTNNLFLQMCIFHHGMFSHTINSNWGQNPYRDINGGMLSEGEQFFYNEEAKAYTKKLLRYIVARWGYSNHLFAWELFNEVQWTGNYPLQSDRWAPAVIQWHLEMSQYIKSIDAFDHLVTTSADDQQLITMDKVNSIDILQYHVYPNQSIVNTLINKDRQFLKATTESSILCGEYGYIGDGDVPFNEQRLAIWTGLFSEVPHMIWRKEIHYQSAWTNLFLEPALFLEGEDIVQTGATSEWTFESSDALRTLGFETKKEYYFGMLYHPSLKDSIQTTAQLNQVKFGYYDLESFDIGGQTGQSTLNNLRIAPKDQQVVLPIFSHGLAFKLKYKAPLDELIAYAGEDATIGLGQSFELLSSLSATPVNNPNPNIKWQLITQPDSSAFILIEQFSERILISPDVPGNFNFELILTLSEEEISKDTINLYVSVPPTAIAGEDQQITLGERATFNGRASFDPEDDPISYKWNLVRRPEESQTKLSFANTAVPNLVPDLPGTYAIELLVNDGYTFSMPDTVLVSVEEVLVSMTDLLSNANIQIYPNPTVDLLFVDFVNRQVTIEGITISSIDGRQFWTTSPIDKVQQPIRISLRNLGLAEGQYYLNFITNKGLESLPFTLQK